MTHVNPHYQKVEYVERAKEARVAATKAARPYNRTILLGIAKGWEHLAKIVEQKEEGPPK